ncbi:MAG: FGGY family carbohydrate kinase [Anaerolineae bacterium]|nr:FGGY family carbohydrate kinase [Thermoflexales bacterium]MDW8407789.1 FGGY family carbohydrate kinase [Anaerolineae bacterium]
MTEVVVGIDVGTQGARVLAVSPQGDVVASAAALFETTWQALPADHCEQHPLDWWHATAACLRRVTDALSNKAYIAGVAADSTSGTIVMVDARGTPLRPALMYNDMRSRPYVAEVRAAGHELEQRLGYTFNASFGLPKMLWLTREEPELASRANAFIHATDFILGKLSGDFHVTNYSDALKSGYDLIAARWPAFIEHDLGIPLERLPRVTPPGALIGTVTQVAAEETGLPAGTRVFSGATDGTAAQIASGAVEPGAWNTSLGTTLVIKGITERLLIDPQGRIYSHRHPEGWWMPGGASNTGAEWIAREHAHGDLSTLDAAADQRVPTALIRYPLARTGERFPFIHPEAIGFIDGETESTDAIDRFAAGLEGTALLERLSYDTLQDIGASVGASIHTTGGGSRSVVWLKIRASALGRTLIRPRVSETAMGAALLAAGGAWHGSLSTAARQMVKPDAVVEPDERLARAYQARYEGFKSALRQRGYWTPAAARPAETQAEQ